MFKVSGRETQNLGGESCVVVAFLFLRFVGQRFGRLCRRGGASVCA